MDRVIPRVGRDKRKSYIEMYAKPQRVGFNKTGYVPPRAVLGSVGVRGGFVSMGERKVEVEKKVDRPVMAKRGGGVELKVEKKEYVMPPEPPIIAEIRKKIAEEEARKKEVIAARGVEEAVEEAIENRPPPMETDIERPKPSEGSKRRSRRRKAESSVDELLQ